MRKWIAVTALVCVLGLIVFVDYVFCQFTLHVPRIAAGQRPSGFDDESITAEDGVNLVAWFAHPKTSNGNCVIVLHGIGDSRRGASSFASMFLKAGYSVLMPDSRAHGESGGEIVTYGLLEKFDVARWAAWARQHKCEKLYGLGESLGGAILLEAAPRSCKTARNIFRPSWRNALIPICDPSDASAFVK